MAVSKLYWCFRWEACFHNCKFILTIIYTTFLVKSLNLKIKLLLLQCPEKAGSLYYNYKNFYSIVLMALVSATYKFLIVDIGAQGKHSDGGIFKNSLMEQQFYQNKIYLSDPSAISPRHTIPYVIVADEAF